MIEKSGGYDMLVVHVHVNVKQDKVEAFKKASIENAKNSIHEPGIARFDVIQQNACFSFVT